MVGETLGREQVRRSLRCVGRSSAQAAQHVAVQGSVGQRRAAQSSAADAVSERRKNALAARQDCGVVCGLSCGVQRKKSSEKGPPGRRPATELPSY